MGVRDEPIVEIEPVLEHRSYSLGTYITDEALEIEINKLGLRTETYKGWAGDIVYIKNQTDENLYIDLTANED